ncbi:MAG: thiaminase II [Deltaproteobacteria bacterium]|nr:thiaminase II [Deltaproteobacteria bacterium]
MSFSERLRGSAHHIWEANYRHPFVQAIGKGDLAEKAFRFYLAQDYVYLKEYCRFLALAAAKSPDLESMGLFSHLLEVTLKVEMDLHRSICAEFGMSPSDLERVRPAPICQAYTGYLLKTAYEGGFLDLMTAFLPCAWGYVEIGQRLKEQGLPDHPHYAKWIETYASVEFLELNEELKKLLDRHAGGISEQQADRLQEIFDFSSRWEGLFWDMAWIQSDWPD